MPLAVVLGSDGLMAGGPAVGLEEVEALMGDIEEQFAEAARLAKEEAEEAYRRALKEPQNHEGGRL